MSRKAKTLDFHSIGRGVLRATKEVNMRYRNADDERIVSIFIEKIDELIDGWTEERDRYKALWQAARAREARLWDALKAHTTKREYLELVTRLAAAEEAAQSE